MQATPGHNDRTQVEPVASKPASARSSTARWRAQPPHPLRAPSPRRRLPAAPCWEIIRAGPPRAPQQEAMWRGLSDVPYPISALFSGSYGLSAMTTARRCSPRIAMSSSVPGAACSGLTIASASDLPVRQPYPPDVVRPTATPSLVTGSDPRASASVTPWTSSVTSAFSKPLPHQVTSLLRPRNGPFLKSTNRSSPDSRAAYSIDNSRPTSL